MRISAVWQIGTFLVRHRLRSQSTGVLFDAVASSNPKSIGVKRYRLEKRNRHCLAAHSERTEWTFHVTETFPSPCSSSDGNTSAFATCTLLDCIMTHQEFSTASQARRAIRHGEILVLREHEVFEPYRIYDNHPYSTSATITESDQVMRVTRLCLTTSSNQQSCYPVEATKYVYPPAKLPFLLQQRDEDQLAVIYENDEMAVVHKPVSIVTIETRRNGDTNNSGQKPEPPFDRDDLQSLLPFILYPPPLPKAKKDHQEYRNKVMRLPRPVHRLDRGTSGLILVAKTKSAMSRFSKLFAERQIKKTYTAVVFGRPKDLIAMEKEGGNNDDKNQGDTSPSATDSQDGDNSNETGGIINYPMDGKPAVTEWKIVETNGRFSRLELQPKTGRYHQLRRHLAFCLGSPIVGDTKYDLVGVNGGDKRNLEANSNSDTSIFRKSFRGQGLFLCCHKLEFDYPLYSEQEERDITARTKADDTVTIDTERPGPKGAVMRMMLSTETPRKFTMYSGTHS